MPKISEAQRTRRREQILDAALRCFADRGFQATSMQDIIAASGLSAGAIYLYFAGKWEIALAVAQRVTGGPLGESITSAERESDGASPSPASVIRAIGRTFDRNGIPPGLVVQIWGEAATDPDFHGIPGEVFQMLITGFRGMLIAWYRESRNVGDAEAAALAEDALPVMLSLAQGYLLQRALMPGFDEEAFLRAAERVFAPPGPGA